MRLVPALLCALILVVAIGLGAALPRSAADAQAPAAALMVAPNVTLGAAPPPGAVVLLAGTDLSGWTNRKGEAAPWKVEDGAVTTGPGGDIVSEEKFDDAFIHLEFREPSMPNAMGQARGNSGVAIQSRYEIQVLDSYGIDVPGKGDCGAVYAQSASLVNACRPPLEWQTYDIIFRAPRFDEQGKQTEPARVTILQNGLVIQDNTEITGPNYPATDPDVAKPGPLILQDHGCKVQYRNVWLIPLPPKGSDAYEGRRS